MRFFFEESRKLSLLYRRLETCGKPFAAAINGVCLGGSFELALACHFRVVSDNEATRVGLPEIKVGLFPGAGGTQRVARLMQTGDALQMLFKGEQHRPLMARNMGLVHAVAPRDDIVRAAKDWIKQGGSAIAPWDQKDFKLPSNKVYSAAGMQVWPAANAIYRRETQDNYPGRLRHSGGGLSGSPTADGSSPEGRVALVCQDPALQGSGRDDPHALPVDAGAEQRRAPSKRSASDGIA